MDFQSILDIAAVRGPTGDCLLNQLVRLETEAKLVSSWFLPLKNPTQYLTLDGSNNVGTWAAAYGSQKVDLSEATNKPVYDGTLYTNRGGVTFNGTTQSLVGTGNVTNWPDASTDLYMLMAGRNDLAGAASGARRGFGYGDADTAAVRIVGRITSGNTNRGLFGAGNAVAVVGTVDFSGSHTVGASFDIGGTSRLYTDGVSDGTASTATATLTLSRVRMGAAPSTVAANFWQGAIVAAAVLNSTATLADFLELEAAMRSRIT